MPDCIKIHIALFQNAIFTSFSGVLQTEIASSLPPTSALESCLYFQQTIFKKVSKSHILTPWFDIIKMGLFLFIYVWSYDKKQKSDDHKLAAA